MCSRREIVDKNATDALPHPFRLDEQVIELAPAAVDRQYRRKTETSIPAYNEDVEIQPEPVALLKDEITRADAVLFATPEYNASVPGSLKNALDWISRPFPDNPLREKRVAVISASQGAFGATWAQAELRKILQTLGASVEQRDLAVPHAQYNFAADGLLRDPEQRAKLTSILETLRGQKRAGRAA